MPDNYKGQPRDQYGRFMDGKQTGSKSKGRDVGGTSNRSKKRRGTTLAGIYNTPPFGTTPPDGHPGKLPPGDEIS